MRYFVYNVNITYLIIITPTSRPWHVKECLLVEGPRPDPLAAPQARGLTCWGACLVSLHYFCSHFQLTKLSLGTFLLLSSQQACEVGTIIMPI